MSVGGVVESMQQAAAGGSRSLVFRADGDFASTLTLGQIIKGKVLRHYDGSRYGVSFGGQEKIVDSAIPLQTGGVVTGKVIRLDDRVHLQRIVDGKAPESSAARAGDARAAADEDTLAALFARYQVTLSPADHARVSTLQARLGDPALVASGALILHKLGLPLQPELIGAVHRALQQTRAGKGGFTAELGPQLLGRIDGGVAESALVQGLAPLLASLAEQTETSARDRQAQSMGQPGPDDAAFADAYDGGEQSRDQRARQEWMLGQWLLNVQNEGSVAHRVLRLPLWFGDRLVEISLALFSQRDGSGQHAAAGDGLRYRKAVFALQTENLGRVEIAVRTADRHLSIDIDAETRAIAETLGTELSRLAASLSAHGWHVDEIRYRAGDENAGGVATAVVEHYAAQDSLSRLM